LKLKEYTKDLKMMHRMYSGKFGDMFDRFFKKSHGERAVIYGCWGRSSTSENIPSARDKYMNGT
jgi:hypothetical protein